MVSNVRMPNGVDTDLIWPGRVLAAIPNVNVRATTGQDFADRYAGANGVGTSITANIRAPDGVDLSLKFTTQASAPQNWTANAEMTGAGTQFPSITFNANGTISGDGGGGSPWSSPSVAGVGSLYQIQHTITGTTGTGDNFITTGVWFNLDTGALLQIQKTNIGIFRVDGTSQIRRKSDGAVVCTGSWYLRAQRTS